MKTSIEWTEMTWNPITGCTKISPGCKHCYAEVLAKRLCAMGQPNYRNGFNLTLQPQMLDVPKKWKKGCMVFVNSMSDLFHKDVPAEYIKRVFDVMAACPQHTFQTLTKRSERMATEPIRWPENVWAGVSIESAEYKFRLDDLRCCDATKKFVSIEPILGDLGELDFTGIDWVIVGGESGASSVIPNPDWVRGVRDQCIAQGKPFFFKQWGGRNKHAAGKELDGAEWLQWPEGLGKAEDRETQGELAI